MNQIDGKIVEVEANAADKELELIQTAGSLGERTMDGHLIDTRVNRSAPFDRESKEIPSINMFNKKVASLNSEYTAMLASTLESQRVYYQENLQEMESNS